ncbi:sin3 histone deacetylase corepressor complex component SDS3 isoform X2 [Passer montanus]|uniref:sin3 histone deacetylase corepressor complex component SDS3 isoform X2 n=1 Tax=Passer montanus TaxID=9160 RepID=UPI001961FE18|nr:sin3 histone deacetylase corepressor complex component SDS3 isoform X2 [Passer montanus]
MAAAPRGARRCVRALRAHSGLRLPEPSSESCVKPQVQEPESPESQQCSVRRMTSSWQMGGTCSAKAAVHWHEAPDSPGWNFPSMFLLVAFVLSLGGSEQSLVHEHEPRWPQRAEELNPTASTVQPRATHRAGPGLEPATLRPAGPALAGRGRGGAGAARKRSAAGLVSAPPAAPPGPPAPAMAPAPDYYEEEELESAEEEDGERSARARDSDEDTEDASETDLAKHEEEDFVEMKEQMYQDKLASLKRQLQQLQEGTLQEYQKRMKKLDQQYKERIRNAELFLQLETDQVEKNYVKEKKAAAKEFEDKKIELKENLIAELEEKKKMIENEKLTMELTGDSMEVKPIMTRKLRRRPNDPVPIPDKRRKPAPAQLNYLLTDEQIMEDLRTLNKLKSPKRPASPSSPEHLPATPAESPAQRFEARIEDGKLYYDKRWYHKSQAIYLESKENTKISCVISSVGANEIWVRKTSDSTKMRIYLGQLQRGVFVIRRRSAT